MNLTRLDVIWTQDPHATSERSFVKPGCIIMLSFADEKLSHYAIDIDVKWVEWSPVVVKD